eukprot:scaffold22259_cov112-Isochrysis_galbana.AAC.3
MPDASLDITESKLRPPASAVSSRASQPSTSPTLVGRRVRLSTSTACERDECRLSIVEANRSLPAPRRCTANAASTSSTTTLVAR